MAIDSDDLMDVEINGKIVKRKVSHRAVIESTPMGGRHRYTPMHYVPVLFDNEECMWFVGSLIPTIVTKTRY